MNTLVRTLVGGLVGAGIVILAGPLVHDPIGQGAVVFVGVALGSWVMRHLQ